MILKFKFKTEEINTISKILVRVANELNVKLGLDKDLENLYAYVEGSEEEVENFSRKLAVELPMSIFLTSLDAEVVNEFKDTIDRNFPKTSMPPCPKCLREFEEDLDIFKSCEVCGYEVISQVPSSEFQVPSLEELVEKLKNNGKIEIQTMNGAFEISSDLEGAEILVAATLGVVQSYFMIVENDIKALGSIEKPMIYLVTNLNFKKSFTSAPAHFVKLPDDLILEYLAKNSGFELLGLKKIEEPKDLVFEVEVKEPLICVSGEKKILVESGEKGLYYQKERFENRVFEGYAKTLKEWELEDKATVGFSLWMEEGKIFANSKKFGFIEYINFDFEFKDFSEVFASIAAMDETGSQLLKNFQSKRPELFSNAIDADLKSSKKGIAYLWGLVGVVLGFSKNIDEAYEKLLYFANSAMTKKGPRIDYRVKEQNIDPLWAVRTAMSFNLAGVDDYLLSYGVIESFAEFLSNVYETLHKENNLDGAVLVGDLFKGVFLEKSYNYISKNYPVFTPKAKPVSY